MTEEGLAEHLQERVTAGKSDMPFGRGETKPGRKQGQLRCPDIGNDPMTVHTSPQLWKWNWRPSQASLFLRLTVFPTSPPRLHLATAACSRGDECDPKMPFLVSLCSGCPILPTNAGMGTFKLWLCFHLVPYNPYF